MDSFLMDCLADLQVNDRVEVTYSVDTKELVIQGVVAGTDHTSSMAIRTDEGRKKILRFDHIIQLDIFDSDSDLSGGENEDGQGGEDPSIGVPFTPPLKTPITLPPPKVELLHEQECSVLRVNYSNSELKNFYDDLPKSDRTKLNRYYDSFVFGAKVNSNPKMKEAAKNAASVVHAEYRNQYFWSHQALRLCGGMLRRANKFEDGVPNCYDCEIFVQVGNELYPEAARFSFDMKDYAYAGAFAAIALLDAAPEVEHDLLIILAKSCYKTEDVSALSIIRDRLPHRFELLTTPLIQDLLAAKNISVPGSMSCEQKLQTLAIQFQKQEMLRIVKDYLGIAPEDETLSVSELTGQTVAEPSAAETQSPNYVGWISAIKWASFRGEIACGEHVYPFFYKDVVTPDLRARLDLCQSAELEGSTCWVSFEEINGSAKNISICDSPLKEAQRLAEKYNYLGAIECCNQALDSPDYPEALAGVVEYAVTAHSKDSSFLPLVLDAEQLYLDNSSSYPQTAKALSYVAQMCFILGHPLEALDYLDQALSKPSLTLKLRSTFLCQYVRFCQEYTNQVIDETVCERCIKRANEWLELFDRHEQLQQDAQASKYHFKILNWKCHAECILGLLDEAEDDLSLLCERYSNAAEIPKRQEEIRELKKKLVADHAPEEEPEADAAAESTPSVDTALVVEESLGIDPGILQQISDEDEDDEDEIIPYEDKDGWAALGLSDRDVIDYALSISGANAIPYALTYLRAGARLNRKISSAYDMLALAVNDPAHSSDYTIAGLFNMLGATGPDYQDFSDLCMSAAFLRTSFQAERGYDYSARSVRDSITLLTSNETLRSICDMLEAFRTESGMAIDIYADYRNLDAKQLNDSLNSLIRKANDLIAIYIETPQRDSVPIILETKKVVFARGGYLAKMLGYIIARDRSALDAEKDAFVERFLTNADQISDKNISIMKIDKMIAQSWDQAGHDKFNKRIGGSLQGERRNNLRSNIADVLKLICQWYALSEQSAGLSWRTDEGKAAYNRVKPQMLEKLQEVRRFCAEGLKTAPTFQHRMGLYAMDYTAMELASRLDGTWRFGQEKYMFVDFLKRDDIMLDEDFLPDLSSSFCVLPEFNILARIRHHVEGEKPSFEERITQIFGSERTRNNYGCAKKIVYYLQATDQGCSVSAPGNAQLYINQSKQQVHIRYHGFLETYALAVNYGQIMQSDSFCYTLEDTVKYWYREAKRTQNFGFFLSILKESETQIHASAQQYEAMLDEQLDALIANNTVEFEKNPGYETAIREQISQQNFIVAEDWMNRIRARDFSLILEQPIALKLLEKFWYYCGEIYQQVCRPNESLESQLRSHFHGFTSEKAAKLIHAWMDERRIMDADRITDILNFLGWTNVSVKEEDYAGGARTEIYSVQQNTKAVNKVAPLHPIAAFGSDVAEKGMYVVCLYGSYTSDSLYEKIRTLDKLNGNKLILLDCALGVVDRHSIAQKMKQKESGIQNVYLILDRVALCFLADNYSEDLVNRDLMAIGIPFSYCMPYVVSSILTMPPEIFIGRKYELSEIESPTGVNLIYGGRQLGKSALFKKARVDIDGNQGRRAVLADILSSDCPSAAEKLSKKLADAGIFTKEQITSDWVALTETLTAALQARDDIKYLLIMLDEADDFIKDCGNINYAPIALLKDVQQTLSGRFKFVLAGLHNIVRFNRSVALGNNAVITHMPSLKVTPFKAPEAEELLIIPLSFLGLSLPSKVTVSQVLATVNYFPGLIQLYAQKLVESLRASDYAGYDQRKTPPYVITDDHIRRVMADKEFVGQIHEKFDATLMLDLDQGYCYYPIALLFGWMYYEEPQKAKQAGFSADDILEHAKSFSVKQIISLDRDRINALLSELEDLNILRSISGNTYLLASKSFRDLLGSYEEIFEKLSEIGEEKS